MSALLAPQLSAVLAENTGGSSNFFLNEHKQARISGLAPRAAPAALDLGTARYMMPLQPAMRRISANFGHAGAPLSQRPATPVVGQSGRQSVCVRLCDGYFFPVGDFGGQDEVDTQEAVCDSLCPGAPTRLYVLPSGSDRMEDAVSARESRPYTALPVAFSHTAKRERTCACHAELRPSSTKILQDFTLRKGDGVMTPKGIRVFRGAQHWPYKRNDFLSLAETRDLAGSDKGALAAIERAAKGVRPASGASAAPLPVSVKDGAGRTSRDSTGKPVRVVGPTAMLEN